MSNFLKQGLALAALTSASLMAHAQADRWQQHVNYKMNVTVDAKAHTFTGTQHLEYTNNSEDTLKKVFYHLYWNAFQPGSEMDVRSRELGKIRLPNGRQDWDGRVKDRIFNLKPDEIGYQRVSGFKYDGRPLETKTVGTILEVVLDKPLLPHSKATFDLSFEAQVPVQIRRSGRDNHEGVDYSMSQWYPKMCEYDYEGWHATPYIAREFYGVWGDYDVHITIDKKYVLAGTGYLQNPGEIGYGYESAGMKVKRPVGNTLTWHFQAPNVHDFVWAADPEYKHLKTQVDGPDGFTAHFFFLPNDTTNVGWPELMRRVPIAYQYIKAHYGAYPYKQYSFIQGGDGGMEYPMATLILGNGKPDGLYGVAMHEWMHSWYQGMFGTNESLYPWMDEGFTTFAENNVVYHTTDSLKGRWPLQDTYRSYFYLAASGLEEPMSTHSDHYNTNFGYSLTAYSKGATFLEQLGYVIGAPVRDAGLLRYYRTWRFKHPNPNDFIRVMEQESGLALDWYKQYFVYSTKHIDYGIDSVYAKDGKTVVRLRRIGLFPMPIDLVVTSKQGTPVMHYIPLTLMYGNKPNEYPGMQRVIHDGWPWVNYTYDVVIDAPLESLASIEIDPSGRLADVDRRNNRVVLQ